MKWLLWRPTWTLKGKLVPWILIEHISIMLSCWERSRDPFENRQYFFWTLLSKWVVILKKGQLLNFWKVTGSNHNSEFVPCVTKRSANQIYLPSWAWIIKISIQGIFFHLCILVVNAAFGWLDSAMFNDVVLFSRSPGSTLQCVFTPKWPSGAAAGFMANQCPKILWRWYDE